MTPFPSKISTRIRFWVPDGRFEDIRVRRSGHWNSANQGFTLMEVVVVLLVIGIITAFAVGRGSSEGVELKVRYEVLKNHFRHAQLRAMNTGPYWGIATNISGADNTKATAYQLFHYDGSTMKVVPLPGEDTDTIDFGGEGTHISSGIYSFDERGAPYYAAASDSPPGTKLTGNKMITVSNGSENAQIQITQHTGFIE
jgi:prepilin-type N-terminal cleavage/methylation domain-containing protein